MKLNMLIAIALIAAVALATWWIDAAQKPQIVTLEPAMTDLSRSPAPDVTFSTLTGTHHRLSDFRGKAVILNFWASWCAPCLAEMPQLLTLAAQHPKNLVLVLMSVDADKNAIGAFFVRHKFHKTNNVVVVWDQDKAISKDVFGTLRYPETILIGHDGIMTHKTAGAVDWTAPALQKLINDLF